MSLANFIDECGIKIRVVSRKNGVFTAEFHEHSDSLVLGRSIFHVLIADTREFGYFLGNVLTGIYLGVETVNDLHIFQLYRAYLCKTVGRKAESRGFNIENNYLIIDSSRIRLFEDKLPVHIVDNISLAAVNHLKILGHIVHTVGKCLYAAVVCNGNCLMSPLSRPVDNAYRIGNSVHCRHIRMTVKFNAFFRVVIHFRYSLYLYKRIGRNNNVMRVGVIVDLARNKESRSLFKRTEVHILYLLCRGKDLYL